MTDFAERLKEIRKKKCISQKELSDALGVSASTVSMYECGSREPSIRIIEGLCRELEVTPSELFGFGKVSRSELKLALFGRTDASDGMLNEVLSFAGDLSSRGSGK
jgi:transcriptional regulator with XRE-family HTH domain